MERNNYTFTEILMKMKRDIRCDWKTVLDWALMAKNSLHNVHGYNPYQLVFGQNTNLPSVLTDQLPTLEGTGISTWIAQHIAELHATRRAFTGAECSGRIQRARCKGTRSTTSGWVYKSPGVVVGQDGAVILVRHWGIYVQVH